MYGRITSRQVSDAIKFMTENRDEGEMANVAYDKATRYWNAWYTVAGGFNTRCIVGVGASAIDAAHNLVFNSTSSFGREGV